MKKVGIMGLGNMGEAIARALLTGGLSTSEILFFEIKPARMKAVIDSYGIGAASNPAELAAQCDYIILAVKPQEAKGAISAIAPSVGEASTIISIMAGVTTSSIISMLQRPAKVVRIMPNIGVTVGQGALGMSANYLLSQDEVRSVASFLAPLGRIIEVAEEQMDAVTALSGSGPAFFLAFFEAMIDGGVKMGLPRDKAYDLAFQTITGTCAMLEKERMHPALMREMVTSPGGTTIAGLVVLDEKGFRGTVVRALEAAQARARELSR
jgi:pyrroline-5-carboxylate reductase